MTTPIHPMRVLGRYALFDEIAVGGMASVHFARLIGPVGFSRTVAIKRLHSHLARDPEFAAGFVDEGRLAARIRHPNVVPIVEILADDGELSLVMDYVEGDSVAKLLSHVIGSKQTIPPAVVSAVAVGSLLGLHAAHEAKSEQGEPLSIVHRDVSPQNILVGVDGIARIVDFGVAKAASRLQTTMDGQVKGKVSYMAPEQISRGEVSRRSDIYALGVVLWEMLAQTRLFKSDNQAHVMTLILKGEYEPVSRLRADVPEEVDRVLARALAKDPNDRYETAKQMAAELARIVPPAEPAAVGDWLVALGLPGLAARHDLLARIERLDIEYLSRAEFPTESAIPLGRPSTAPRVGEPRVPDDMPTVYEGGNMAVAAQAEDATEPLVGLASAPRRRTFRWAVPALLGGLVTLAGLLGWFEYRGARFAGRPLVATFRIAEAELSRFRRVPRPNLAVATDRVRFLGERLATSGKLGSDGKGGARVKKSAPCPKYFVDAQGIKRVNAKCL